VRTFLAWCIERGWMRENPAAGVKGIGKRRPRGKTLGKASHELRVKEARAWYAKALDLADGGDEGATAALVALLLGMRALNKAVQVRAKSAKCGGRIVPQPFPNCTRPKPGPISL
jgi:site-specific recombinase XerC